MPGVPKLMPPAPTNPNLSTCCFAGPEEKHLCSRDTISDHGPNNGLKTRVRQKLDVESIKDH